METKAHHTIIGMFAIATLAIALLFLYWIAGVKTDKDVKEFHVIFQGSVSGLSAGGGVLFNGLKVGEVRELGLNPYKPTEVRALIKVNRLTPVHNDTRAILSYQGLTGVASIELTGGTSGQPMLANGADGTPATIYADRTFLQNISDRAQETVSRVNELLIKFDKVLAAIDPEHIQKVTQALGDSAPAFHDLMVDSAATAKKLNGLADKLDVIATQLTGEKGKKGLLPEATEAVINIRKAAENFNKFSGKGFKDIEVLLTDTRRAVTNADRLILSIEKEPTQVIWGKSKFEPQAE